MLKMIIVILNGKETVYCSLFNSVCLYLTLNSLSHSLSLSVSEEVVCGQEVQMCLSAA